MNERIDLDRLLSAWLTADAPIREPEPLLERVLARTARTRRRAAWRIPERWFPVSTITTRVEGVSRFPWRTVGAVALLMLVLIVGALVIAGTRGKTLPAPFGPAANGPLIYSVDGDIVGLDALTGKTRTIIGGPAHDWGGLYSPTGDRLAFLRGSEPNPSVWIANADGSDPRQVAGPLASVPGWGEWSPEGDVIALSFAQDPSTIHIVRTDGSGTSVIETGLKSIFNQTFRPPDGAKLTFKGETADGTMGIYLMDRDGANLVRLELDPGFETTDSYSGDREDYFNDPAWSPDGRSLLYHTVESHPGSPAGPGFRIHQATIGAGGEVETERTLEFDREADDEFAATWLPSGKGIVFSSIENSVHRMHTADLVAGAQARDLGVTGVDFIGSILSPDGRKIALTIPGVESDQPTFSVLDLTSLVSTPITTGSGDFAWQRTAE